MVSLLAKARELPCRKLGVSLISSPGVPSAQQSEDFVLPYLDHRKVIFRNAKVLDIGTGNGVIALYAAKLGASNVVATDINPSAIRDTLENAKRLKLVTPIDARTVPANDHSAYSVIANNEKFDVILANPPYTVDLDGADANFTDSGLLGPSIISGLKDRLNPKGVAILLYRNLFYHLYLAKFARQIGLQVKSYPTDRIPRRELEILFNSYATRLDQKQNNKTRVVFDSQSDELSELIVNVRHSQNGSSSFPGILVIAKDLSMLD